MNSILKTVLIGIVLVVFGSTAFGQGAHYTYPFSIVCPEGVVRAGEAVTINAKFEGGYTGDNYGPVYNWSVSNGTIASGQGTRSVTVEVPGNAEGSIHVTLDRMFREAHFPEVEKTASCSIGIEPTPKAILVDEFSTLGPCEEGNARMDGYFVELNNNPVDRGVIVIYDSVARRRAAWYKEQLLSNFIRFRRFDRSRVTFIRGPYRDDAKVQFWRVPPGASDPEVFAGNVAAEAPESENKPTEPYVYATRFVDGLPECNVPMFDLEAYAAVLNEDAGNRGNIVVGAASQAAFREDDRELRNELEGYGVPRSRIRTFFKKVKANAAMEFIELWILPAKQPLMPLRAPDVFVIRGEPLEPPPSIERAPDTKEGEDEPPLPPPPPPRVPKMISGGVLNGKATSLPKPAYPDAARAVRASGAVHVQVTVDEQGNVISASAVSGHPLLRASAVQAARAAKFSRTLLSGVPVKVSGVIVYNFVP